MSYLHGWINQVDEIYFQTTCPRRNGSDGHIPGENKFKCSFSLFWHLSQENTPISKQMCIFWSFYHYTAVNVYRYFLLISWIWRSWVSESPVLQLPAAHCWHRITCHHWVKLELPSSSLASSPWFDTLLLFWQAFLISLLELSYKSQTPLKIKLSWVLSLNSQHLRIIWVKLRVERDLWKQDNRNV